MYSMTRLLLGFVATGVIEMRNFTRAAVVLILCVFLFGFLVQPAVSRCFLDSARDEGEGKETGLPIDSTHWIGSRFHIDEEVLVTEIGGHLLALPEGTIFGAIVALSSSGAVPEGSPFNEGEVVASTIFNPGWPSSLYRMPVSVILEPGDYALVFGTDALGASGGDGAMPQSTMGLLWASWFGWDGTQWHNHGFIKTRHLVCGYSLSGGYCIALGGCGEYISGVRVGTIDNTGTGCDSFADYTSQSTEMEIGDSYLITVTNGQPLEGSECGMWIDWNHDGIFDGPDESITATGGPEIFTASVAPPADTALGNKRMRVRMLWTGDGSLMNACGSAAHGEVEDYTITVTDKEDCSVTVYGGGCGSEADPYLIDTTEQMQAIGVTPKSWNKHFRLTADIDLSGYTGQQFNMIGTSGNPFTGVFDGDGHTISGFTYRATDINGIGVFAYVGSGGVVQDLRLEGISIWFKVGFPGPTIISGIVGALVGSNGGTILRCSSSGSVAGSYAIGGLVGANNGNILQCSSEVGVSGYMTTGGLVGSNDGTIADCYAAGNVSGDDYGGTGGLTGGNIGSIARCYSVGRVSGDAYGGGGLVGLWSGEVVISFWDTQTSEQSTSSGGTGKTTAQMQTRSTFTDVGWDFVGEEPIGAIHTWRLCNEGAEYSKLLSAFSL